MRASAAVYVYNMNSKYNIGYYESHSSYVDWTNYRRIILESHKSETMHAATRSDYLNPNNLRVFDCEFSHKQK